MLVDLLGACVMKRGELTGRAISRGHLDALLHTDTFLRHFHPITTVTDVPRYLSNFEISEPGYNKISRHEAVYYTGNTPQVSYDLCAMPRFLDVMAFETNADRTNAVAAALTVMLRGHWPGGKPIVLATATKSHAGKDTILDFAAGVERKQSISYQDKDWPVERSFVAAAKGPPCPALIVIENARLGRGHDKIASAYIERFTTDPNPMLFSTGTGGPVRVRNDFVVAISTNSGQVSEDLLNRCLPIHLVPRGDIHLRGCPIGNPRHTYLPEHRERIAAELRGMIERWKCAGRPAATDVAHPFSEWARVIGGILRINGFVDFLANYGKRKSCDDPVREGLATLGAARPDDWLRPSDLAGIVENLGLVGRLISVSDRECGASRARGLGVLLSKHVGETVMVETEDGVMSFKIGKTRQRFSGIVQTRYRFARAGFLPAPTDEDPPAAGLVD
ncbi:MAG: hypothetical protein IT428_03305 [Planctomycetaceae bacterium]|nr:hypothetical protein [Planctomycetaceae bacterium]